MKLDTGRRLGRYEILAPLGAGGMGEVYRARDLRLGREVAVKVLPERLASDSERLRRFEREARASSLLNHPNVLVIYDIGTEDGLPFLVTELLEGESLRDALRRGEAFSVGEAVHCATRIARGLAAAHDKGIVHRDLKPENVYLLLDGRLKILDFGLAKLRVELGSSSDTASGGGPGSTVSGSTLMTTGQRLTATGMLMGTVGYMSPEQAAEREVDFRADQFALGVVLYEMLSGHRPFQRATQVQTLAAVIEAEPESVADHGVELADDLVAVIDRLLAKSAGQRYESTHDLVEDLERIAESQELTPSPRHAAAGRRCPRCSHKNDATSRFCGRCGASLTPPAGRAPCPSCGHHASGTNSFCDRCGHRLSGSSRPPTSTTLPVPTRSAKTRSAETRSAETRSAETPSAETPSARTPSDPLRPGERRQATVAVSFLDGYSDLVEYLPPAEVEEVMERLRDVASEVVERHRGVIHRFTGEELVVIFGIPAAREDDFARGVGALRELHGEVRGLGATLETETLALRSGIDTGWIVTQLLDGDERFSVTGEALRAASALATRADGDEILVGAETRRLISAFHETEPGGALTPFVGREQELAALRVAFERAHGGEGQLAVITGEAGAGKTRLAHELVRCLDTDGVRCLSGHCRVEHGSPAPAHYAPFVEALRCGLDPMVSPEEAIERILAVDPDLDHLVPFYLHLLEMPSEEHPLPQHLSGRHLDLVLAETLAVAFTAFAQSATVVLRIEHWQRADEGSRAVMKQLLELLPAHRILLVVTHRPEGTFDWGRSALSSIHLGALAVEGSSEVLAAVAGVDRFPAPLAEVLHERTGGNPFFLEETCRAMLESRRLRVSRPESDQGREARLVGSIDDLELPATVQAVLRARFDRLDPATREVARRASVIGRDFTRTLLERTVPEAAELDPALETLREMGIVQQTRVVPEPAYRFKHALTRDVAYESLLQHQRRSLHTLVGEALEELDNEADEELAHHFSRARDWAKAVAHALEAAARAESRSQFSEALELLEKAREWLSYQPESTERRRSSIDLMLRQERLCETLGLPERQQELLDEVLVLIDPASEPAEAAEVYRRQGELATLRRRFADAQRALSEALRTVETSGDTVGRRNVWRAVGFLRWHQERYAEALEANRAALRIDREAEDYEAVAIDLMNIASVERGLGEHDAAREHLGEALGIFERLEDAGRQIEVLHLTAVNFRDLGDNERALEYLERARGMSTEHHAVIQLFFQLTVMGNILLDEGRVDEGLACFREAADSSRRSRYAHGLSRSLTSLGEVLTALGRHREALPHLREAAGVYDRLGERDASVRLWRQLAGGCEREGRLEDALDAWRRVHGARRAVHDTAGELEALEGMARASRGLEAERASASSYYESAVELARQLGDRRKQGDLLNSLGILEWSHGRYENALRHYAHALQLFRDLDDGVHAGLVLNSMGATLARLGWHEEAVSHLEEAMALHRATGERLLLGHALAILGEIHFDRGEGARARELFEESLGLRRELGDRKGEGWMTYQLARIRDAEGSPSAELLDAALALAEETGDVELEDACRRLRSPDTR